MTRPRLAAALATTLAAAGLAVPGALPAAQATVPPKGPKVSNGCVASVPEPGAEVRTDICYTLFKPAGASRSRKVPMILHSHGWGGSRTKEAAAFRRWLDAGFGVLSFDQRGFGESGGQAHIMNPAYEGKDVTRLVRFVSRLDWVRRDGKGDPRLGAIGGSYGGGYQLAGAFRFLMDRGEPVFDALAPEITWWDLKESLAPQEVVRAAWALLLSAAGQEALPQDIKVALAEGLATGMWPDGTAPGTPDLDAFFERNGPRWHVEQGRRLDIPVLFRQGATDSLFPLDQGLKNFRKALTPRARKQSIFIGYNGGHTHPAVFPPSIGVAGDPCSAKLGSKDFADLAVRFMQENLKGRDAGVRGFGRYHLGTADGERCLTVRSVAPSTSVTLDSPVATPEAGGPPVAVEVAQGPLRVAGTPSMSGTMTALGLNNRAFYALAVGTSPLDAKIVQHNMLPVNEPEPVAGEQRRITLPSVAVRVPEGQNLYVLASATSDTFVSMGSRTPGAILLEDVTVRLPLVG
jgi:ABC-2 type transport system ATP-binding protein